MFKRRHNITPAQRLREFVWPRAGWHRTTKYVFHRVARLPGTPYSIAAGFACGAAISFTPFVGLHFVLSGLLAWGIRANIVASAIGTVVGNPWTFPFIWIWIYELGTWLGVDANSHASATFDFAALFADMLEAALRFDLAYLWEKAIPTWWPMLVGSIPTAIVVWFAFYLPLKPLVAAYQIRRFHRRQRRFAAMQHQETEP